MPSEHSTFDEAASCRRIVDVPKWHPTSKTAFPGRTVTGIVLRYSCTPTVATMCGAFMASFIPLVESHWWPGTKRVAHRLSAIDFTNIIKGAPEESPFRLWSRMLLLRASNSRAIESEVHSRSFPTIALTSSTKISYREGMKLPVSSSLLLVPNNTSRHPCSCDISQNVETVENTLSSPVDPRNLIELVKEESLVDFGNLLSTSTNLACPKVFLSLPPSASLP